MLLLAVLLLAAGCAQPTGIERLLGEKARTPAHSSDGSCDFDLAEGRDEAVFRVLGAIDEYLGRTIVEDSDAIETFYCDESTQARWFGRQLETLAREQGLASDVRVERSQDCLAAFRGRAIAERINSCYRYQTSTDTMARAADGTYRRTARAFLSSGLFLPNAAIEPPGHALGAGVFRRRRALAYVEGAWARRGQGTRFVFANSREKSELLARLLTWLGADDVRAEFHQGRIPATATVEFSAGEEIAARLRAVERDVAALVSAPDPSRR